MTFYLGAPDPHWLATTDRPLMVSPNRLRRIENAFNLPVAEGPWILDSGAYDVVTATVPTPTPRKPMSARSAATTSRPATCAGHPHKTIPVSRPRWPQQD
jgi:hypothetical protein